MILSLWHYQAIRNLNLVIFSRAVDEKGAWITIWNHRKSSTSITVSFSKSINSSWINPPSRKCLSSYIVLKELWAMVASRVLWLRCIGKSTTFLHESTRPGIPANIDSIFCSLVKRNQLELYGTRKDRLYLIQGPWPTIDSSKLLKFSTWLQ